MKSSIALGALIASVATAAPVARQTPLTDADILQYALTVSVDYSQILTQI